MKLLYESSNGWGIAEQPDLLGDQKIFCIYRFYPNDGWQPYKTMGSVLSLCFVWLWKFNFISKDELDYQISELEKKQK